MTNCRLVLPPKPVVYFPFRIKQSAGRFRYGSICSGIEAATVAWETLGWQAAYFSEIDPFCCEILDRHYPSVPNLGDLTKIHENKIFLKEPIDLLVGGTPCQSFSVAGLRKGLDDPRGNLCLEFLRLAGICKPRWVVWENVPGVLSSNGGRDFGSFLGALVELGYGFAYRVLDAQYFGVPQRRRRVFVVGYLADWRRAAAVLFEPESLSGSSPTSKAHKDSKANKGRTVGCLAARDYKGVGNQYVNEGKLIAFNWQDDFYFNASEGTANPLRRCQTQAILTKAGVHRLTPLECERLQGFPDDYTLNGSDGPRFKALGNSMAVPVMRWIGQRIQAIENIRSVESTVAA